jgi:hypothetical protein
MLDLVEESVRIRNQSGFEIGADSKSVRIAVAGSTSFFKLSNQVGLAVLANYRFKYFQIL